MQCQEIASDPTYRPMYSDISPTFICSDKRDAKPTKFCNPCDDPPAKKKRKQAAPKKDKDKKKKSDPSVKSQKAETTVTPIDAKVCLYAKIYLSYTI